MTYSSLVLLFKAPSLLGPAIGVLFDMFPPGIGIERDKSMG